MQKIFVFFLLLSLTSCSVFIGPENPDTDQMFLYENRFFSLYFPTQNWRLVNLQGIDSHLGYYENGKDKIYFDYGMYNGTIDRNKEPKPLSYVETTINGSKAIIVKESSNGDTLLTAIIKKGGDDSFISTSLSIRNPSNEQEIIKIFKTHKFK